MPKPVCVACQRFYRPKRNGVGVTEMRPTVGGARPGTVEPEAWTPYKIWLADLWHCEGCGHELVTGFGFQPLCEDYMPDFAKVRADRGADRIIVNDC